MKALTLGLAASLFFAVTFVLNQLISVEGGSWIWSASLRYFFMTPFLAGIVLIRKNRRALWRELKNHPWQWFLWSHVGFGLFYAPLCFAASYSPAWMVAGTWQITIIAGALLAPLFFEYRSTEQGRYKVRRRIPFRGMGFSLVILIGIVLMEASLAGHVSIQTLILGCAPIVIAAFAYPLGNRKMMALCNGRLDAYQRTLGMTVMSLPLWIVLSFVQWQNSGLPSLNQTFQSLLVALFSGVIATVLFFKATDLAQNHMSKLAAVEATQSCEVLFATLGQLWLIAGTKIGFLGVMGLVLVIVGMIFHSVLSSRQVGERALNRQKRVGVS